MIFLSRMIHKLMKSKHYPSRKCPNNPYFAVWYSGYAEIRRKPPFSQNVVCGLYLSFWKTINYKL